MPEDNSTLGDVRVLDLSEHIAGPFCTKLLAGLGAEVIKVERPGVGDASRKSGPFLHDEPHPETSASFLYLNTGKKSITLDLESEVGRSILLRLIRECDILVESFPPGHLDKRDLGYASVRSHNPKMVFTSISPFGQAGLYKDYKGSDIVAQAMGGLMHPIGLPERGPLKIGGNPALYTTGMSAFSGTMVALHVRDIEGYGQHVDISAMETMAVTQIHSSINYQFQGADTGRRKSNLVRAKDGWANPDVHIGIRESTWDRFFELLGKPELSNDPRFATSEARGENEETLNSIIKDWVADQSKEDVYHQLQGLSTVAGYVATVEDLLNSGQFVSRRFFQSIDHPFAGEAMYPGAPFSIDGDVWHHSRAPLLGEHNVEVYCGLLGHTREDLAQMEGQGVI
ncbi:MAG: CoA transferase [Dehalococcoidia bacterium]